MEILNPCLRSRSVKGVAHIVETSAIAIIKDPFSIGRVPRVTMILKTGSTGQNEASILAAYGKGGKATASIPRSDY
jgi:hypothetical protein